jgi:hypothetical protein
MSETKLNKYLAELERLGREFHRMKRQDVLAQLVALAAEWPKHVPDADSNANSDDNSDQTASMDRIRQGQQAFVQAERDIDGWSLGLPEYANDDHNDYREYKDDRNDARNSVWRACQALIASLQH